MKTWDDVLDDLSTYQKTADAARVLIDNGQMELGCMMLRDTLKRDSKFAHSAAFIAITKNLALRDYLFAPSYAPDHVVRLTTNR